MSSIIPRTTILIFSRFTNFAILFLSPILLVRILDVYSYGQYREFILFAMLFYNFFGFAISGNLLYYIPKFPENEKKYFTHTVLFLLFSFLTGFVIINFSKGLILSKTSYDFINPLIIYLFFSLNLSIWDSYWIAKKRSDYVFYFSNLYMLLRILTIITIAYYSKNVISVVYGIVFVEGVKFFFLFFFFLLKGNLNKKIDLKIMKEQLFYFIPLGIGSVLMYFNFNMSQLFVSVSLGVESLAIYTIASHKIPIMNLVRSSINDSIFPDIVEKSKGDPLKGLELWKKSNVIYCFVSFPLFIVLFYHADIFITTLFTSSFDAAILIFKVFLFLLIIQAFEMTVPLKGINKTKYFIFGGFFRICINFVLLFLLTPIFGLLGAALAMVISGYAINLYLGFMVIRLYQIKIKNLFMWEKIFKILLAAFLCFPVLLLGKFFVFDEIFNAIAFSITYSGLFVYVIVSIFKVEEICIVFNKTTQKLREKLKRESYI